MMLLTCLLCDASQKHRLCILVSIPFIFPFLTDAWRPTDNTQRPTNSTQQPTGSTQRPTDNAQQPTDDAWQR